ncbi:MAG TPA: phospholipase D-like domain-containing protein, partial [Acidobacteriota bacterium]
QGLADAEFSDGNSVKVLPNGENYYEAELEAIENARSSINLEAYIFQKGDAASAFLEALTNRARAGCKVNLVIDGVGSFATWNSYFKKLIDAGGRVKWYHPLRLHLLPRFNNRTHRELIIIDGSIGFVGGAGIGDHWFKNVKGKPRWRDTMFRVEGEVVHRLQCVFAENWLEASGEILMGEKYFPDLIAKGPVKAMAIGSTPSAGRSTRARIVYQTLIACAQKSIHITTPYFLPDTSLRKELVRAMKERNVDIQIITPGKKSDHLLTRRSSRRLYGDILKAGGKIYEYKPAMIHAKILEIDGVWSVVGSTNLDHRSFGLNDEVNLIAFDPELASTLESHFVKDRAESSPVSYGEWERRPFWERLHELLGWVLERQQ